MTPKPLGSSATSTWDGGKCMPKGDLADPAVPLCAPSPTPGSTSGATETIVLTLTASGSVSDYSDTSAIRGSIAASVNVDPTLVLITVAAAEPSTTLALAATTLAAAILTAANAPEDCGAHADGQR